MESPYQIIKDLEDHCGTKIEDRRLRFQIIQTIKRLQDQHQNLISCLECLTVIKDPGVYNKTKYTLRSFPNKG
jgi:hypothetical protein